MFRSKMILWFFLIFIGCIGWTGYLAYPKTAPVALAIKQTNTPPSAQTREKVRKDIYLAATSMGRLHHRIESDRSLIAFHPHGASIEVVEHLFGVRCWVQEKNSLKFVLAEEGTYRYDTETFEAQDVMLSMYKIPTGIFPAHLESHTPFLRGHAESITFSLQSGSPRFDAFHFRASLGDTL